MDRLAASQASRSAKPETRWRRLRKAMLAPLVNGFGSAFGWALRLTGTPIILWVQTLILNRINPEHLLSLSSESAHYEGDILRLIEGFKKATGRDCCFLILFTHPEPGRKMQLFSVALYHHVCRLGKLLYDKGFAISYPRLLLAIDPFALDSMGWLSGSFYAGFADTFHLAMHRQPTRLSRLQRIFFLKKAPHAEAGFKFVNHLKPGRVLALAQAGGEPQTARLLFTTREFTNLLCKRHVHFDKTEFLDKLGEHELLPPERLSDIRRRAAKGSEHEALMEVFGFLLTDASLESGALGPETLRKLGETLGLAGVPQPQAEELAADFEEEFKRYTPYRERLFRILVDRILKPDIPVMLIPLWHQWDKERVHLTSPEILWQLPSGEKYRYSLADGKLVNGPIVSIARYARDFTTAHFPR